MTLCSCIPVSQDSTEMDSEEYKRIITSYLLSNLARLPTSLRMHVDHIISFPVATRPPLNHSSRDRDQQKLGSNRTNTIAPRAFMSNRAVAFFGMPSFGTWIHEFAHALDVQEGVGNGGQGLYTDSSLWKDRLTSDSCVADEYAMTSPSEVSRMFSYCHIMGTLNGRLLGFCASCYS
jgi:hypothetical protein